MEITRERLNAVNIEKCNCFVSITYYEAVNACRFIFSGRNARLNSAMTKDLIKQEMMCRVLSFRPTEQDKFIYRWKYVYRPYSSLGKNEEKKFDDGAWIEKDVIREMDRQDLEARFKKYGTKIFIKDNHR